MKEKKVGLLLKEIMLKYFREAVQCENNLRLSDAGKIAEQMKAKKSSISACFLTTVFELLWRKKTNQPKKKRLICLLVIQPS